MHLLRLSSLHAALATTIFLSLSLFSFQANAGRYLITVLDAKITKKKTQFKRWDTGFGSMTLPDSYVVVDIGGQRLTTTIQKNNLTPTWNISKAYTLNGNEKVYLEVRDKDGFTRDDLIGKTDVPLSQLIKNGNVAFGNVLSLRIKVLRIDKPKARPVIRKAPVVPRPVVRKVEPRKVEPAPRRVEPAPRKVEPAPRKVEPAPRKVEPAPRKVEPAPRKVEPAPRKVEPAPRKVEPAPRKVEPAPRATAPKEDPKVAFCIGMMKFSLSCLKQQREALKNATGAQARTAKFLSMIIAQIEKNLQLKDKSMLISKCDAGLKRDKIKPSATCMACIQKQGCKGARNWKVSCAAECSATAPTPAPRTTTPAPAPRKVEPAPRKVEPAPRKVEPAPRKVEPAPRKVEPAPRKVEPAPRKVEPAPRKVEPAPRKTAPTPTATNAAPAPKATEAMTPAKFCSLVTSESLRCLNVKLEQFKADPQKARSVQFFKMVIEKFKKDRKKNVNRCVTQFAKHQKKRASQGKTALTSQHLQNCWNCFKKAGCSRNSRKACAPVCTGK